jgi:hypothetical protein
VQRDKLKQKGLKKLAAMPYRQKAEESADDQDTSIRKSGQARQY